MIIIHFMISEQEPMLRVIIVYGGNSSTNRMLVSISISILSSDSIIYFPFYIMSCEPIENYVTLFMLFVLFHYLYSSFYSFLYYMSILSKVSINPI